MRVMTPCILYRPMTAAAFDLNISEIQGKPSDEFIAILYDGA